MGQLLLVRHGQASWGSDDYDVLSGRLGAVAAARQGAGRAGIAPDVVVTGGMRRHRETAEACLGELGGDRDARGG